MPATRTERDSLGEINVTADRLWGAQTERALEHFSIGDETMPLEVIHALGLIKKAAATANHDLGGLEQKLMETICAAADEVTAGALDDHFPLKVWMSGSGTQANMNVNEVIANRANEKLGFARGSQEPIHPNDHVNMSQSSNDAFPAAMHIAAARLAHDRLIPAARALKDSLAAKADEWKDIVKVGRTHLQDAVPLTLGQEFSAYAAQIEGAVARIGDAVSDVYELPLGATAVGTGLNAPAGFAEQAVALISQCTQLPFKIASNAFAGISSHDALVAFSGALRGLAVSLKKIADDIALMGSGPRAGLAELILPANEPGSSIMPGKVNPTQCEAMAMVAVRVMGNDAAVGFAGACGHLNLNTYKPLIIFNVLQSARLLSDVCTSFARHVVAGLEPNRAVIERHLSESLMLVTALSPAIGYDRAAEIARYAHEHGVALKDAALTLGFVAESEFDRLVDPKAMAHPHR